MKKLYLFPDHLYLLLVVSFIPFFSLSQTVVNGYAEVNGVGTSTLSVSTVDETYDTFEDGDQVIIMQMQDNVIGTTSNSINFGDVGSIESAGLYEVKTIASHHENGSGKPVNFTFTTPVTTTFNTGGHSSVQLITFPEFGTPDFTTVSDYTSLAWDGEIGGILAFQVLGTLTLAHNIDADEKGFRGAGADKNQSCGGGVCESTVYISQWTSRAKKGEGIYKPTNPNMDAARGRILNGGGGGSCHNGAGGGGSNFSEGGNGGVGWGCKYTAYEAGGFGGLALGPYVSPSRIFMGGGGGAGERNNGHNTAGGNGGGIILIKAGHLEIPGTAGSITISANGASTPNIGNDGAGGAGAGGTVLFEVGSWSITSPSSLTVHSIGGNGGSSLSGGIHGGGGGGGQGAIIYSNAVPTSNITNITSSGAGGCGNTSVPCNSLAESGGGIPSAGVIGTTGSPLPVELLYFTADAVEKEVHLAWQTASELNSDYFIVERMDDYGEWMELLRVNAAGNSSRVTNYNAVDFAPKVGENYYRLIQVDHNGEYNVYDPVVVQIASGQLGDVVIYPNPSYGVINIAISEHVKLDQINVIDMSGKMVRNISLDGQYNFEVNLSDLPRGVYFVQVNNTVKKLVLSE